MMMLFGSGIPNLLTTLQARATYYENQNCTIGTLDEIKAIAYTAPPVPSPFIISVKTDNVGTSNNDQFTIPWTGTYDVDWGDGNTDTGVVDTQTHTYATNGTYDVSVTAASGQLNFNNTGDKAKLLDISNWGDCTWTSVNNMFFGCSNLATISATDSPDLSGVTKIVQTFSGCTILECDINHWDVSSLSGDSFYRTFKDAKAFNSPLNNWDVSGIIGLYETFHGCNNFNQPLNNAWNKSWSGGFTKTFYSTNIFDQDLSGWDVSSVTNMSSMFSGSAISGSLSNWDVSSVTGFDGVFASATYNEDISGWDVSSATNFIAIFRFNSSFNQPIGNWDVSNVTSMRDMFRNAFSFDQDISNWQISQVTNFGNFMPGVTLSTTNYDALLIAWDGQGAMSYSGTVDFGNSQYTLGGAAEAARTSLIAKWGAITDGGAAPVPLTTNLVASYSFDTDFTDYTGNNNLTVTGNVLAGVAGGVVDDCADFEGTDDYTVAADSDDFSFTDGVTDLPFSISFWANFNTFSQDAYFLSKRDGSGLEYQMDFGGNGLSILLFSQGSTSGYLDSRAAFTPTTGGLTWQHFTFTYDGSGTFVGVKMYIDGVSQTITGSDNGTYVAMSNTTSPINIGSQSWNPTQKEFDGKMDEYHVWKNRELTQAEVTDIYTTELGGTSILP